MANSFKAEVIASWRITIDKEVRENLKLKIGDYVEVRDIVKLVPNKNAKEEG